MPGLGIKAELLEVAVIVIVCGLSLAGPMLIPPRATFVVPESSKIVMLVNAFKVGGSFTGRTLRRKELVADTVPSLTVMVIVELPKAPGTGVEVTVRLAPLPPKTTLAFGSKFVSEEPAESVRRSGGVSRSPIVNDTKLLAFSRM